MTNDLENKTGYGIGRVELVVNDSGKTKPNSAYQDQNIILDTGSGNVHLIPKIEKKIRMMTYFYGKNSYAGKNV